MKKIIFLVLMYNLSISFGATCQNAQPALDYIKKQISIFKDSTESPLTKADFDRFDSIPYYQINKDYIVVARVERMTDSQPFEMITSTDRRPLYVEYCVLNFELRGVSYQLSAYRNVADLENEEYSKYLFIPFADQTNGFDTYGGGRFMELLIPEADTLLLDFNQTFNPLCAYNHRYSCPKPPIENHLKVKIEAGVKSGLVYRKD